MGTFGILHDDTDIDILQENIDGLAHKIVRGDAALIIGPDALLRIPSEEEAKETPS